MVLRRVVGMRFQGRGKAKVLEDISLEHTPSKAKLDRGWRAMLGETGLLGIRKGKKNAAAEQRPALWPQHIGCAHGHVHVLCGRGGHRSGQ